MGASIRCDADDHGPRQCFDAASVGVTDDYPTYDNYAGILDEMPPPSLSTRLSTVRRPSSAPSAIIRRQSTSFAPPSTVDHGLLERPGQAELSVARSRPPDARLEAGMRHSAHQDLSLDRWPSHRLNYQLSTPAEFERPVRSTLNFDSDPHRPMSIVGTAFSEPLVTILPPQTASAIFVPSRPIPNVPHISGANFAAVASAPNPPPTAGDNFAAGFLAPDTPLVAGTTHATSQAILNAPQFVGTAYATSPTVADTSQIGGATHAASRPAVTAPQTGAPFAASQPPRNPPPNSAAPVSQTAAVSVSGPAVVTSPTEPKRSLPTIKLNSYDGSTPLQTHLSKLDNCAAYYNWNAHDRLCHLKASLVGQAGEVL